MPSIPVLMYHYISTRKNSIAVHPENFAAHLQALDRDGFTGIGLDDAREYFVHGRMPVVCNANGRKRKPALITFDDGFLDNWVYALPLLRKYGHKGIVFAVSGKIEQGSERRPTLEDVWSGSKDENELPRVNNPFTTDENGLSKRRDLFMNWQEVKTAHEEGVLYVQAHSRFHDSVFTNSEFSKFYQPENRGRTFDRVRGDIPWGLPRFSVGPALSSRAFIPSDRLLTTVREFVPQQTADALAFFSTNENVIALEAKVRDIPTHELGSFESDDEHAARIRDDFSSSMKDFQDNSGIRPIALAWPWGAQSETGISIAREFDIKMLFDTTVGPNPPGHNEHIHRFKAKDKSAAWMRSRLAIYSRPWLARLYSMTHR